MKRLTLFSFYDPSNTVDLYVVHYLLELSKVSDIIFSSDCVLNNKELKKVKSITPHIVNTKHGEYDFGSHKRSLEYAKSLGILKAYDWLILANDSCFGPFTELLPIFQKMESRKLDFWGFTHNTVDRTPHIQSYFVSLKKEVIKSKIFTSHLNSIEREDIRKNVVFKYEHGLTKKLKDANFIYQCYFPETSSSFIYDPAKNWDLMIERGFPFLKRTLFTRNQYGLKNLERYPSVISKHYPDYDISLIRKNLKKYNYPPSPNLGSLKKLRKKIIRIKINKSVKLITICGISILPRKRSKIITYWLNVWEPYLKKHEIQIKIDKLKESLDPLSKEYIDKTLSIYWSLIIQKKSTITLPLKSAWCKADLMKHKDYERFIENDFRRITFKYRHAENFNPYLFFNQYSLSEFFPNIDKTLKNKTILDCGAFTGDTACLFSHITSNSDIISIEPNLAAYERLNFFIKENQLDERVKTLRCGVGNKHATLKLRKSSDGVDAGSTFSTAIENKESTEYVLIRTIDDICKQCKNPIGLIKFDIEGYEKKAILGALETIQKYKPILLISLYHNPIDFFEIKPLLQELGLGYRFAIRRSEVVTPLGDIILIAY